MNSDKKDCNRFLMYNLSLVIGNFRIGSFSPLLFGFANFCIIFPPVEGSVWEPLHGV